MKNFANNKKLFKNEAIGIIRKATLKDLKEIDKIYQEIFIEEEKGNTFVGWVRNVYPTEETAKNAILRNDIFVMEEDGNVIGTAIINGHQEEVYEKAGWEYRAKDFEVMVLHTLAISPRFSCKGYGKKFISFYELYAKENGCKCLRIDTNEKNMVARKMYAHLGYKEVGIFPCVFNKIEGVNLVLLEKLIV